MGLDLTMLPVEHDGGRDGFSHSVLRCDNGGGWWDALEGTPRTDAPDRFHTYLSQDDKYEESHYGETATDPYGLPVRCVRVRDILRLPRVAAAEHDTPRNRAVIAYLRMLDPATKVALYWH